MVLGPLIPLGAQAPPESDSLTLHQQPKAHESVIIFESIHLFTQDVNILPGYDSFLFVCFFNFLSVEKMKLCGRPLAVAVISSPLL